MKKTFATIFTVLLITLSASSLYAKKQTVEGTWTFSVPEMSLRFVLLQKGNTVSGTLQNPHGSLIHVTGEFSGGRLKFSGSSSEPNPIRVSATGNMKADGSLAGNLTSTLGDMDWTAIRTKAK
jgi:hypothetical protein